MHYEQCAQLPFTGKSQAPLGLPEGRGGTRFSKRGQAATARCNAARSLGAAVIEVQICHVRLQRLTIAFPSRWTSLVRCACYAGRHVNRRRLFAPFGLTRRPCRSWRRARRRPKLRSGGASTRGNERSDAGRSTTKLAMMPRDQKRCGKGTQSRDWRRGGNPKLAKFVGIGCPSAGGASCCRRAQRSRVIQYILAHAKSNSCKRSV